MDLGLAFGFILGASCLLSMLFGMIVLAGLQTLADRREARLGDILDKGE